MRKIWLIMLLCLLCGCAHAEETVIVHATDMHYLSPQLTDSGEAFMQRISAADGKMTHYTPQLMQAFVMQMLDLMPDAVILSGDLTLNGAPQSHIELAALLDPLTDVGIQVLVLPGNHDTGGTAYRFIDEGVEAFEAIENEDFDNIYAACGYRGALSRDAASQSYAAQIAPGLRCLMVDVNANGASGTATEETLLWIERQLSDAGMAGDTVIAVSHQPLLSHNPLFGFGYTVNNASRLTALYREYRVAVNLCGHLHMQHIAKDGGVEICTSSMAVSPNQYGVLYVEDGELIRYETQPVDVARYLPEMDDFREESARFFDETTCSQLIPMLEAAGIDAADNARMLHLAADLNARYFAGTGIGAFDEEAWEMWQRYFPDAFFTTYMSSIIDSGDAPKNRYSFTDK